MGAGKTTVGKKLGERIGRQVVDTDEQIETNLGLSISELFEKHGEQFFRSEESKTLQSLTMANLIVTTGGGIILNKANRDLLKSTGFVIFLDCHPDETLRRLKNDMTRPLLQGKQREQLVALYNSRLLLYKETADLIVNTTNKSVDEIVTLILAGLK